MRKYFREHGCRDIISNQGYPTIQAYEETVLHPGSTGFQVGGFQWAAINVGNGLVEYRILNVASAYSFFLHFPLLPGGDQGWKRVKWYPYFGNITQHFRWREQSPCECQV
jgi:hypothetical protein